MSLGTALTEPLDVAIIGGGIIGIATAAYLAEVGCNVTVIDRTGICEETSSGNAGALAFSDILPLSHKGLIKSAPKWLLDPLGPLSIPPAYLPSLMPWLYRFWRAGNPRGLESSLSAQATLMAHAERSWDGLVARAGVQGMVRSDGSLEFYESENELQAAALGWAARDRFGIPYRHLKRDEIEHYQPGLSPRFVAATFVPGWKTVSDPRDFGRALWAYAEARGAQFIKGRVETLGADAAGTIVALADGRTLVANHLVLAAGAWSHRLAAQLGEKFPLETERGYNTTLPVEAFDVRRQLIFSGHGFVITPLATGLRVGGAVEFGGLERKPNFARSRAMLEKAKRFLPGLETSGGREWMGFRPSLPDSLPVIGRAKYHSNIVYAFGHGHLGLTQAAATGSLVCDLLIGQKSAIDIAPFSPQRF
ncbi:FAD-dependent oxidoreductase [Mesorhizobium sp. NBSH29]|uniref:NAD(P)/FAD-dependent oxidoreductase n=1 Tax=Mesorhizobium sp. NBSH29 TaxID=2654249 RepID=UPI001896604E|nr:FAD-dependent oxidoreductase [Mesorhizobium sp. NBSH29]QPC85919.1 FAD-dependent oxidoreductase [Mesorhizobium sp. NBSH29]